MVRLDDNVLFIRGNGNSTNAEDEDIWDDSALIKAYDKAINLAKEEVGKRMGMEIENFQPKQKAPNFKPPRHTAKPHKKWAVGAPCRAVYSEDGEVYEAVISKIYENSGTCIVKFVGYGNTEKVELNSLLESNGLQSQIAQHKDAVKEEFNGENADTDQSTFFANAKIFNGDKMDCEVEETETHKHQFMPGSSFNSADIMPPAPPLPPQLMAKLPDNDADALSSMLMSWYISGFHTGYYHGLKQARSNQEKRKNC
ncbi:survival motor neuron protein [Ceratina calcarata]|uniref:Survival motor neuron protein n=1 Tax=Ceratina calcarata TaxID=156304 RepID=A0AAJ7JBU9_9HYME|nr:survival motor neuron protein [Ceratina calcarata]